MNERAHHPKVSNRKISIIIPALNEEEGIARTLNSIPEEELKSMEYDVEIILVDGGSKDRTKEIANELEAKVIVEPRRGYGIPLRTGFAHVTGDIIVTADADCTYPLEDVPYLIRILEEEELDFLTTDRFTLLSKTAMSLRNRVGNAVLNLLTHLLFSLNLKDSQSGMWIFRRNILDRLVLKSNIPFSQEIKIEACYFAKCRWKEIPIRYRRRIGNAKFGGFRVGVINLLSLFWKKLLR